MPAEPGGRADPVTSAPLARLLTGDLVVFGEMLYEERASLGAQLVKNLPAMQETWVPSLGWEDPLEKGTATHSSILAWRVPGTV